MSSKMYLALVPLDLISSDTHHYTFVKSVSQKEIFMKGIISDFVMPFRVLQSLLLATEFINGPKIF